MSNEVKTVEKSISYIAWSVKEMAESLKVMAKMMTEYMAASHKSEERIESLLKGPKQDEIPF
jgi:hypothetical protein